MALSDLTFKLYTDSGLTAEYSGLSQLVHESDLSDGDQDFTFYFGSVVANRLCSPDAGNITFTPTNTLAEWATATAYTVGNMIEPTTPNTYVYRCTTAGTSHASTEPTFPTGAIGDTVVDGTAVWTLVGKRHEITEATLALSAAALDTNVAGDPLDIASSVSSGVGNAIPVYVRITNAVATVQSNTSYPNFGIYVNAITETEV